MTTTSKESKKIKDKLGEAFTSFLESQGHRVIDVSPDWKNTLSKKDKIKLKNTIKDITTERGVTPKTKAVGFTVSPQSSSVLANQATRRDRRALKTNRGEPTAAEFWEKIFDCFDLGANKWQVKDFIRDLLAQQKKEIGKEFKKWFHSKNAEDIEDAIERITGVKV